MKPQSDFEMIAALDLEPIKVKLMHRESGEGWSLEQANAIEAEYRRFLYLMKKFPNEMAAPSFDVDIFWHYHILDTVKYARDCEAVFGYFLHHFPYLGLCGEEDRALHHQVGERMRELYEDTFGEPYLREGTLPAATTTVAIDGTGGIRPRQVTRATDTAYCIMFRASSAGAQTAYCIMSPLSIGRAQTAYSICAVGSVDTEQSEFMLRRPSRLAANQMMDPALSERSPPAAPLHSGESAGDELEPGLGVFYANRPRLQTAGVAQRPQ